MIVWVAGTPPDSDLSGDEVGATSRTTSSEAAVRRASSSDADTPAESTAASEVAETGSETNSPTSATSRRILRLTLLGPPDLAEALVDIEVKERASGFGLSNINLSTMWRRQALDIDLAPVFAFATPDRLELVITHPECAPVELAFDLTKARRSEDGHDQVVELKVRVTPRVVFTGRIADEDGEPLFCTVELFPIPKGSGELGNAPPIRTKLEAVGIADIDENGAFVVSCERAADEYLIAAHDANARTEFWRGTARSGATTDVGELRFSLMSEDHVAGIITAGGKPLEGMMMRLSRAATVTPDGKNLCDYLVHVGGKDFALGPSKGPPSPLDMFESVSDDGSFNFEFEVLPSAPYRLELFESCWIDSSLLGMSRRNGPCVVHPDVLEMSIRTIEAPCPKICIDLAASWLEFSISAPQFEGPLERRGSIRIRSGSGRCVEEAIDNTWGEKLFFRQILVASGETLDVEIVCDGLLPFRTRVTAPPPGETLPVTGTLSLPHDAATSGITLSLGLNGRRHLEIESVLALLEQLPPGTDPGGRSVRLLLRLERSDQQGTDSRHIFRRTITRPPPGAYDATFVFRVGDGTSGLERSDASPNGPYRTVPVKMRVVIPATGDLDLKTALDACGRFFLTVDDSSGVRIDTATVSLTGANGELPDLRPSINEFWPLNSVSEDPPKAYRFKKRGIEVGNATLRFIDMPPGRYEVTVNHPDYAPKTPCANIRETTRW